MNKKIKILHLEGLNSDIKLVDQILKKENLNFESLVVNSKDKFIKALNEDSPDIILADHFLPSFNSYDALTLLQETGLKIPFIIVTGHISEDFAVDIIKSGADDYIFKDRPNRLPAAIHNALEKFSREKEREHMIYEQAHLAAIVNASNEGIISKTLHGIITSWNISAEKLFGYPAAEAMGKHISIIIPPDRLQEESEFMESIKRGASVLHFETVRLTKNGTRVDVSLTVSPLNDTSGKVIGAATIVYDVTEKKKTKEMLLQSEQRYRKIAYKMQLESARLKEAQSIAKVGSWETDLQTFNIKWSEETHHIFETDPKTFQATHEAFYDFLHPEDRDKVITIYENSFNSQTVNSVEHKIIATNGTVKHIMENWKIFRDAQGHPLRAMGTCQDITEQKIAENKLNVTSNELKKAVADLNKILDSSLDVICTIDANGEFIKVSAASQIVWGYTPEELIGTKFINLVYHEDVDRTLKAAEKIVSGIQVPIFENRYVHKSGKVVHILWSVNWDEKLQLMFCIAKDVTEKKRLEKAVENERDQFFDMFLQAPSAIGMLKGTDHVFEMVNPLYLQLTGKTDVIGKTVAEVLPEVIEQGFVEILDDVYRTGETYIGTETLVKLDKEENGELTDFYMNFVYQAYRNGKGEIEGIFFFINEVTERILSRKAIEKSEKFFKGVIESSADMITLIDAVGKTMYASPAVSKIFGYTYEECLEINIADIVHPDDALIMQDFVEKIMMHPGVPMEGPLIRHKGKDGSYIWVEGTATNFLETEGINAIIANFRDVTGRKEAEEDNIFKAHLLTTIGQAVIATDLDGVVNYWNRAAEDIYGWTKEEAVGKNVIDLTPSAATYEQAIQIMEELKKGHTWSGEFKVRKKDGTNFPALITNSPIYDENNKLSGIIGISSDITEKKKLEDLLEKSNRMARIGSWEYNTISQAHYWSPITREIFEVKDDPAPDLQTAISYYKSGASRSFITYAVDKALKDGLPWDLELQIVTAKGKELWVRDIGEAEFINGKCIRLYGSFQDINARKKAELEILNAYREKNIILESIGDGFYALDKNWVITYWNKQAEIILKKSRREAIGKNLWELYPNAKNSISYTNYHIAVEEKRIQHYERFSEELDRWLEVSAYPSSTGLSVFFKDITDRKIAETQLGELNANLKKHASDLAISNKELEEFAYVASHDLQEPLRMVTGFLGQIQNKYSDVIDDKGKQYIHFAVDGAKRMRQIILDLLEFSRIGRTDDVEKYTDLNDVLREVMVLCQKQIKETSAIVRFENLPSLVTHQTYLRQVFQNLVSNALKYHVKGRSPVINISAEERGTHWQFAISDNGIGIEAEYFNKIFVIFQRLHNKDEYSGTGIGLAVCKKIIENLGGKIWLASEEDKGTTFYFTIPKK